MLPFGNITPLNEQIKRKIPVRELFLSASKNATTLFPLGNKKIPFWQKRLSVKVGLPLRVSPESVGGRLAKRFGVFGQASLKLLELPASRQLNKRVGKLLGDRPNFTRAMPHVPAVFLLAEVTGGDRRRQGTGYGKQGLLMA